MMKLAIMNHHPGLGGAETSLLTFLRKIDRKQFDVTVILPDSGERYLSGVLFEGLFDEAGLPRT